MKRCSDILTDCCSVRSWEWRDHLRLCLRRSRSVSILARLTFCERDNLLNEGVATVWCNRVRVDNSSHLINHCIAFNSASNFARLKSRIGEERERDEDRCLTDRERIQRWEEERWSTKDWWWSNPKWESRLNEKRDRLEKRSSRNDGRSNSFQDIWCCWNHNEDYRESTSNSYQWNKSNEIDSTIVIDRCHCQKVQRDKQRPSKRTRRRTSSLVGRVSGLTSSSPVSGSMS